MRNQQRGTNAAKQDVEAAARTRQIVEQELARSRCRLPDHDEGSHPIRCCRSALSPNSRAPCYVSLLMPASGSPSSDSDEEARALLQARVALFWKVMFFIIFLSSGLGAVGRDRLAGRAPRAHAGLDVQAGVLLAIRAGGASARSGSLGWPRAADSS